MVLERVQKIIAAAGYCSRRDAEDLIERKKVKVDGKTVKLGDKADETMEITVDGRRISRAMKLVYLALYKPRGVVCTVKDDEGRPTVIDLVRSKVKERVFPVGRLDLDSEGLVLLTNDGAFANELMHPRYKVHKQYVIKIDKPLSAEDEARLVEGVRWDGIPVRAKVRVLDKDRKLIDITIQEGRKHIIKNIMKKTGYAVLNLKRVRVGHIVLGDLKPGTFRRFDPMGD